MRLEKLIEHAAQFFISRNFFEKRIEAFNFFRGELANLGNFVKLGFQKMQERGAEQGFSQNHLESCFLIGLTVNMNLALLRFQKKKTVNNKLKLEVAPAIDEGEYWKNILGG